MSYEDAGMPAVVAAAVAAGEPRPLRGLAKPVTNGHSESGQ